MLWIVAVAVVIPALVSAVLTAIVRGWARRTGFVDSPGGHKGHDNPTPLGGGIAITWTLCGTVLAGSLGVWLIHHGGWTDRLPGLLRVHASGISGKLLDVLAIVAGAVVLHVTGLIDDRRPLGPMPKLVVQVLVAVGLVWGFDIRAVEFLGPAPSIVLTVLWLVLIINAFNFLDNTDGLSAGVAAIVAAILAAAAMMSGQVFVPAIAWVLVGSLLGFLLFNFSPASIFMGDAGSMVVGYFLGVLTVLTTYYDPDKALSPYGVLAPGVVLAVPLYDVASVVWVRIRAGDSPFHGDRRHFSHRLIRRGMSPRAAVLTIYLATAATSLAAMLLPHADWPTACMILVQTLCVVLMIAVLEREPNRRATR